MTLPYCEDFTNNISLLFSTVAAAFVLCVRILGLIILGSVRIQSESHMIRSLFHKY